LITHLHSDHIGGLTTPDGNRAFPNPEVYVAKADSDSWLSPEIAAKAPKDVPPFFQSAQAIAAPYIKAGKWHAFGDSETKVDGMQLIPCVVNQSDKKKACAEKMSNSCVV
jgi:glyoxylase-like metal-dependent hydrolase (beta-lactamase superfamily II)